MRTSARSVSRRRDTWGRRFTRFSGSFAGLAVLALVALSPTVEARVIKVCVSDRITPPLVYQDREGLGQELIRRAVEAQGDRVEITPLPWRRCLESARHNEVDIALTASPSTSNLEIMDFPTKSGEPDRSRALLSAPVVVLARKDAKLGWNGSGFTGLTRPVLYLSGQAIIRERLAGIGIAGDDGPVQYEQLVQMLLHGRGEAAVMRELVARSLLFGNQELRDALEILPQPFMVDNSYAPFSKGFTREHREYAERIWNEIGRLRAQPEWQAKEKQVIEAIIRGERR